MFNRDQLAVRIEQVARCLHHSLFALYLETPVGEAFGAVHRGPKRWYGSALDFWIASSRRLAAAFSSGSGAEDHALCRPLDEQAFLAAARQSLSGLCRVELNPQGPFVAAMMMSDGWNEVAAIAEYGEEYIAVCWNTAA